MARESMQAKRTRAAEIHRRLQQVYPHAATALTWRNPFQLLVATILSAQCTDEVVNQVTPALFRKYPTPQALAAAEQTELERDIYRTGFFRNKARSLKGMAQALIMDFGGRVPETMAQIVTLPGVARKTANVVLQEGIHPEGPFAGIVVDTHVKRVTYRLGLTRETNPDKVECDLMALLPNEAWRGFANAVILLGRQYCMARNPNHAACPVECLCPKIGVT